MVRWVVLIAFGREDLERHRQPKAVGPSPLAEEDHPLTARADPTDQAVTFRPVEPGLVEDRPVTSHQALGPIEVRRLFHDNRTPTLPTKDRRSGHEGFRKGVRRIHEGGTLGLQESKAAGGRRGEMSDWRGLDDIGKPIGFKLRRPMRLYAIAASESTRTCAAEA